MSPIKMRTFVPGERHHWWPMSVSKFWTDEQGLIGCISSSGKFHRTPPIKTARISDGHNFKMGSSCWDHTIEGKFDHPDSNFPRIVEFLENLVKCHESGVPTNQPGFHAQSCTEPHLHMLCECLVSLVVRSPKFRKGIVSFVEHLRNKVGKKEYKPLITANIGQKYSLITRNLSARGKFLVIFSDSAEFVFGDGFYNNLSVSSQSMHSVTILAPVTPNISVLYALPMQYMTEPRLVTLKADEGLVALLNETIQVYAKDWLFYKAMKPKLSESFSCTEHLVYSKRDPIEELVEQIPGIPNRQSPWL